MKNDHSLSHLTWKIPIPYNIAYTEPKEDLPYKKDRGAWQKFWKEHLRDTKILFCGCGMKCFPSLRYTNSKATNNLLSYFPAKNLKQCHKSTYCGAFEAEDSKRYQNCVFNSWKVQWTPQSLLNGSPPQAGCAINEIDNQWPVNINQY